MMGPIFLEMRRRLAAKGVPYELTYGPPKTAPKVGATRISFYRDYTQGDSFGPPRGQRLNPRQVAVRVVSLAFKIFACSTKPGAERFDHEEIADDIVEQLRVELDKLAYLAKTRVHDWRGGFEPDDSIDTWSGVVYVLRAQIDRGDFDRSWLGDAAPEATNWRTSTTLEANGPGADSSLPTATTRLD